MYQITVLVTRQTHRILMGMTKKNLRDLNPSKLISEIEEPYRAC